jgi:hypothetical protein
MAQGELSMTTSTLRVHKIVFDEERCYTNGESTARTWEERTCGRCGQYPTPKGHDRCLGTLPGVTNACCGHGKAGSAYVQFDDWVCIRGAAALYFFEEMK